MHFWLEREANRGSIEITSCLHKSILEKLAIHRHKEWIFWSDSCGGQNRNIRMTAFLLRLVHNTKVGIEKITHRFPEPGHSFLPNDQDFGVIDTAKRLSRPIYAVEQYQGIIREATSNPSKFQVTRMKTGKFFRLWFQKHKFSEFIATCRFDWRKVLVVADTGIRL